MAGGEEWKNAKVRKMGESGKEKDKEGNAWLEAYRRVRKKVPPPTRVKPGKKGKGVPYKREREDHEELGE